jgi:hypothetical protein
MSDWISAISDPPASTGPVLVWTQGETVQGVYRKGYRSLSYFCNADGAHLPDVTHWRPLLDSPPTDPGQ